MSDAGEVTSLRAHLSASGFGESDLQWLDRLGWEDAAVPPIKSDQQRAEYTRLQAALVGHTGGRTFAERATLLESKLAAAIGAHVANWDDRGEDEED